jgi:hypothetical protein
LRRVANLLERVSVYEDEIGPFAYGDRPGFGERAEVVGHVSGSGKERVIRRESRGNERLKLIVHADRWNMTNALIGPDQERHTVGMELLDQSAGQLQINIGSSTFT